MRRLSSKCLGTAAALLICSAAGGRAPANAAELSSNIVRAGVLADISGSCSDISGRKSFPTTLPKQMCARDVNPTDKDDPERRQCWD